MVFTFVATAFDPIVVVVAAAAAAAVVGKPLEVTTAATVEEEQERETVWFFFLIAIDGFVTQVAGSVNESCEEFPAVTTDEDPGETELEAEVVFCDRCTTGLIDARVFDAVSTAADVVAEGRADLWAPIIAVVDPFFSYHPLGIRLCTTIFNLHTFGWWFPFRCCCCCWWWWCIHFIIIVFG